MLRGLKLCAVLYLFVVAGISCSKGNEDDGLYDTYAYYDYYSDIVANTPGQQTNTYLTSSRVCYNITKDKLVWEKPNEVIMPKRYAESGYGFTKYSRVFSNGESLIKIFTSCDIPTREMASNGVYFQKINKKTGNAEITKKIIAPAEFDVSNGFVISAVESDGSNYYFSCNNNYVYAYDANGNQKWKKGNYVMGNVWSAGPTTASPAYTFIYYNDNKIFFITQATGGSKLLVCLNSSNGAELWTANANWGPGLKKVMFSTNYAAGITDLGYVILMNKSTGQVVDGSNPPSESYNNNPAKPIGPMGSTHLAYFTRGNNIGQVQLSMPNLATVAYLPNTIVDYNFIVDDYDKNKVYGRNTSSSKFEMCGLDLEEGVDWQKGYNLAPMQANGWPIGNNHLYGYVKRKGGALYLFTDFNLNGADCANNEIRHIAYPNSPVSVDIPYPGIIAISRNSGNLEKQCKKIPVGKYENYLFNFLVE